ncbi:MAG: dihydrolipoyl dehydrogenase [Proteobacteria bacterium]|nr:dihydrolipoyl dehydrogenase [Pseudomonadota bacterium]
MDYDVVIIGSGPGGYVAAIRCAQLKMKTALIEKYPTLGGTCLNVGCIPSKALLDSSEHYHNAQKSLTAHGIQIDGLSFDWQKIMSRKEKVIADTCNGINFLMKKNGVDVFKGIGAIEDTNLVKITGQNNESELLKAKNIILATGSKPSDIPGVRIDKQKILSSSEILSLPEVPSKLIVIGAGAIGIELGSVFKRLGTEVDVIEYLPTPIPTMDGSMAKELLRTLKKLKIKLHLEHRVLKAEVDNDQVLVTAKNRQDEEVSFSGDYCLMAVGRKPYTNNLGLEKAGLETDEKGFIKVDSNLKTNIDNIYAIGDVIGGAMLAHKAEEEGVFLAETLAGKEAHINYKAIPAVVYTWPEVASVGLTEEQLKNSNHPYKTGSFPYRALGRARAANELDGLVKVLADSETDQILGVHIIGARAADMIAEAVVALEFKATAADLARFSHAHPSFSEALKEACLDATGNRALHK